LYKILKEKDLPITRINLNKTYLSLGGNKYFKLEFIDKHDLTKYRKSFSKLLVWNQIVLIGSLLIGFVFMMFQLIFSLIGLQFYNVVGNFFFFEDTTYIIVSLFLRLFQFMLGILVGFVIILINTTSKSSKTTLVASVISVLTFPFGILLLLYSIFKVVMTWSLFQTKEKVVYISTVLVTLSIVLIISIELQPLKEYDVDLADYNYSDSYVTQLSLYDDRGESWVNLTNTELHIKHRNDKTFEITISDFKFTVDENLRAKENTLIEFRLTVNDIDICYETKDEVGNLVHFQDMYSYNEYEIYCKLEKDNLTFLTTEEFNIDQIEVKLYVTFTDFDGNTVTRLYRLMAIEDMRDYIVLRK